MLHRKMKEKIMLKLVTPILKNRPLYFVTAALYTAGLLGVYNTMAMQIL